MSNDHVKLGFEQQTIELDLKNIVPLKTVTPAIRESRKFQQITASIREVGIIEPLVVTKEAAPENRYILLDGHLRLECLKKLGKNKTVCLISTDDEAFTYNKYISRQAPFKNIK